MVGAVVLLAVFGLYVTRRVIAREILTAWFESHGVVSTMVVHDLSLGRFAAQVQAGDPRAPDFVADEATVTYGFRGLNPEVRSVTLRHPLLRARLHDGRLSLGALQPLVEEFLRKPPRPNGPKPSIEIHDGRLLLATDYGPVRLTIDAMVKDGRVLMVKARSDPAHLQGRDFTAHLGSGSASLRTQGNRVSLALTGPFDNLRTATGAVSVGHFSLEGEAPYPDLNAQRLDGPLTIQMGLAADRLRLDRATVEGPRVTGRFQGRVAGWIADLSAAGTVAADVSGAAVAVDGARARAIRATLRADDLRWAHRNADVVSATPRMTVTAQDFTAAALRLSELRAAGGGLTILDASGLRGSISGSLDSRGSWTGLEPISAADPPELAGLKRAAQRFQIAAPGFAADFRPAGWRLDLPRPVRISTDSGARVTLSARQGAPVRDRDGGSFSLTSGGGGLPRVALDVGRWQWSPDGVTVQGEAKMSGAFGPIKDGAIDGSGILRVAGGAASFRATRCASMSARKLNLGANDIDRISVRLCPSDGPMFSSTRRNWEVRAQARDLAAGVQLLQARVADGAGRVIVEQTAGQLAVTAVLGRATVIDDAPQTRFYPLRIGGTAQLRSASWNADFALSTPKAQPVADGALWHDTRNARGGLRVETGELNFAADGLQPDRLSPLALALGSPVEGRARFTGQVDWTPAGVTSGGTLRVPSLDFHSAAGKVSGLKGTLVFSNLAPLIARPGQTFSADSLAAIVPVTAITAGVGLGAQALTVTGGEAAIGGGHLRIESLRLPLVANAPMVGVLMLDAVQLHDLVAASPFGDRVELDAKVSGRVPFETGAGKIRIADAELHAVQAGRLSINRHALTSVPAAGRDKVAAKPPAPGAADDTFTDFAYQAMENLAFDKLQATIASRDDGRLGILAHVVGRHDPPQHQEIRLSLFDLIGRKFLNRPLPLPSDTGVDLTLDTTLNLDDLVTDYADYQKLRSSRPVQPAAATTETKPLEIPR